MLCLCLWLIFALPAAPEDAPLQWHELRPGDLVQINGGVRGRILEVGKKRLILAPQGLKGTLTLQRNSIRQIRRVGSPAPAPRKPPKPAQPADKKARALLRQGCAAFNQSNHAVAADAFEKLSHAYPDDKRYVRLSVAARFLQAESLLSRRAHADALAQIKGCYPRMRTLPERREALRLMATIRYAQAKPGDAARLFGQAAGMGGALAAAVAYDQGVSLQWTADLEGALRAFERALSAPQAAPPPRPKQDPARPIESFLATWDWALAVRLAQSRLIGTLSRPAIHARLGEVCFATARLTRSIKHLRQSNHSARALLLAHAEMEHAFRARAQVSQIHGFRLIHLPADRGLALKIGRHLERGRIRMGEALGRMSNVSVTVVLLRSARYQELIQSSRTLGHTIGQIHRIVLRLDRRQDYKALAVHEYSHVLNSRIAPGIPSWLNEGIAYWSERRSVASMRGHENQAHMRLVAYLASTYPPPKIGQVLRAIATQLSPAEAFQRVYGKSLETLTAESTR